MGWMITAGVVFFLAVLPLGVSVKYNADGPLVRVVLGPIKFTVFPLPKNEKKEEKPKKESPKQKKAREEAGLPKPPQSPKPEKKQEKPKEKGGSWTDFLPLVKVALDLLNDFRRKLRVNVLELKLIMAGGDPCDLAVNYGRAWAAVGNLMPQLERFLVIKKRDIEVECDFTELETKVIARLDLTITLGRILAMVAVAGYRGLKEFLKIKKKRKGGAVK